MHVFEKKQKLCIATISQLLHEYKNKSSDDNTKVDARLIENSMSIKKT